MYSVVLSPAPAYGVAVWTTRTYLEKTASSSTSVRIPNPPATKWTKPCYQISTALQNFAVIYLIDITQLTDSNKIYKLSNPCSTLFYRNKHIMIHLGYRYNKINCAIPCQKLFEILKVLYGCTCKGKNLVDSPRIYSTRQTVLVPKSWSEFDCTSTPIKVYFYILHQRDLYFLTFNTASPIES